MLRRTSASFGLTRSVGLDLATYGVRVNAVGRGWTRTQLVQEWFDREPDPREPSGTFSPYAHFGETSSGRGSIGHRRARL
jgi:NAD(P)-dependent dehydrogenase (short-subunit alcohol dehydrogenase family)